MKRTKELQAKLKAAAGNHYHVDKNPYLKVSSFEVSFEQGMLSVDIDAEIILDGHQIEAWSVLCVPASQANDPSFGIGASNTPGSGINTCSILVEGSVTDYLDQEWGILALFGISNNSNPDVVSASTTIVLPAK